MQNKSKTMNIRRVKTIWRLNIIMSWINIHKNWNAFSGMSPLSPKTYAWLLVPKLTTCVTSLNSIERSFFSLLRIFSLIEPMLILHLLYFWCTRLRQDAKCVIGPDHWIRFWGGRLATSLGYEVASSPHHCLSAGLLVLMQDWAFLCRCLVLDRPNTSDSLVISM